ncbi:MAG: O-antigen ligase family protein [Acidobacteriota bacterium]
MQALPANLLPAHPAAVWSRHSTRVGLQTLMLLVGVHAAMGIVLDMSTILATLHALATLALGLRYATTPGRHSEAIYVCGYIAGSDVLWRMTKARVFWEYSKYAVILILVLIMLQRGVRSGFARWGVLYFGLLVPSSLLTIGYFGITHDLRRALSFNLSGPLALAVAVIFFSGWRGPLPDLSRLLQAMVLPVTSVFAIAAYSTLTASRITFGLQANFVTSGGYGPNQVSAVLGVGALMALLLALNTPNPPLRLAYLGLAGVFQLQSLLTFSRGGTFNVLVATLFLGLHFIQHRRARNLFVTILGATLVIGVVLVLPRLDAWTSGMMTERFSSLDTTGRQSLAEADLALFQQHPLVGVGPGLSQHRRTDVFRRNIAAHTEHTRLLAEHGILGLAALAVLVLIAIQAYRLAPTTLARGWVTCLSAWAMAEMAHSAMRIVAISFLFGLALLPFHKRGAE